MKRRQQMNQGILDIKHTPVFTKNYDGYFDDRYKILFNQGGTGSSKTISILQLLIVLSIAHLENTLITIARKTLNSLKATAMRDFVQIMNELNLYDDNKFNKSDYIYSLGTNQLEFIGLDQPQKKRGAKRGLLYCNEANELNKEDWTQLIIRNDGKTLLDFNPSDEFHFLYDEVLTRKDCLFIQSTYKDNPFLSKGKLEEIKRLKEIDENYWRVYGLGERGMSKEIIYTNWEAVKSYPEKIDEVIYGLDFGFNNPTALTKISFSDTAPYVEEMIYESKLTNSQLIERLESLEVSKTDCLYCDNAEPNRIEEISQAGYNAIPADKSVKDGIDYCKRLSLKVIDTSVNGIKELKTYKWKTNKDGHVLDEPVKLNDHFTDSLRYGIYTHGKAPVFQPNIRTLG